MQKDHTNEVEKRVEAIHITRLDCCSFYTPRQNSLTTLKLCAFCQYGFFVDENKNGLCKYRLESTKKGKK